MKELQKKILETFKKHPGIHLTGPSLAAMVGTSPRTLRSAIRSLRFDHDCWHILSRAGDDPMTDGYWISTDKREIEANRQYHERYGKSNLARAGRMTPVRSEPIAEAQGQQFLFN